MAVATLTLLFPDANGIELCVGFERDESFSAGIELQQICLSGETCDFSEWLSESAIALIEQRIQQEIDSADLCSIAVDYENAA